MKDTFVLKTTIKEFSTMKECFEQEKIGKEDLIITNEFIYNSKFKEIDANVLFQERYGVGEPTDEMIENIRKDVSKDIKRIIINKLIRNNQIFFPYFFLFETFLHSRKFFYCRF